MGISLMIAFGFGRAVSLDACRLPSSVARRLSNLIQALASDDCGIPAAKPNPKIAAILTVPPCTAGIGENN